LIFETWGILAAVIVTDARNPCSMQESTLQKNRKRYLAPPVEQPSPSYSKTIKLVLDFFQKVK
jgi:hypothetical protein